MKLTILSIFFMLSTQSSYIEKYTHLAQISSQKYNIPIEIILAQAILESDYGRSNLARRKNNHFGIRRGKKYVAFKSVEECYDAHGRILSKKRYDKCRECGNDLSCWAYGLQKAGYATSKDYPKRLLKIINQIK